MPTSTGSSAPSGPPSASTAASTHQSAASGGKIVFSRHDLQTDDTYCFTINPDGTDEAKTHAGACGTLSPDGRKVLITVYQPNGSGLLVGGRPATTSPDGSDLEVLDAYPGREINLNCASWSPDGQRFLCASAGDGLTTDNGIYTMMSSDGGDLVRLTTAPSDHDDHPQGFSPDGSRILFERLTDTGQNAEFVMDIDGTDLVRLSPDDLWPPDYALTAGWSPDGSKVVFTAATVSGGHPGIYVVNADGSELGQIASPDVGGITAQWSPDGQSIAATTCLRCQPQVFIIHTDGTGRDVLTDGAGGSTSLTPIWSPDGAWLLYQTQQADGHVNMWTMRPDGSDRGLLADAGTDLSDFSWGAALAP